MNINHLKSLSFLAAWALTLSSAISADAQQSPVNIALNKPVSFSIEPNYDLTIDAGDKQQLTDGQYASRPKWVQKATVGWNILTPVVITIDLQSVQPISGVSYSAAAGIVGVTWPSAIYIGVSDDNKNWRYAGDLVLLSRKNGSPPAEGYADFRYVTHDLQTKARYISLAVVDNPFTFVDEIEVYKGDDAWTARPATGSIAAGLDEFIQQATVASDAERRISFVRRRMDADIAGVRQEITDSSLPGYRKNVWLARLDKDAGTESLLQPVPLDFRTVLPLNAAHRDILALHGELLAAKGYAALTTWKLHRYSPLPLLAQPAPSPRPQLEISMLRRQFRSDDLLLTNAGANERSVTLQIKNAPPQARPGWLTLYSAAWIDTMQGVPVASALLPVTARNGHYKLAVPAGMTGKVWFSIDSCKVAAGAYKSTVLVKDGAQQFSVPLLLDISKKAMATPRFSTGLWDFTDVPRYGAVTDINKKAVIEMMRSHYVDTPWATGHALPLPVATDFDSQGILKTKLDFSKFDSWIANWPGARRYFVYADVADSIADAKINTPEFTTRVGSWARALAAHMKELHLRPKQLGLLLVDEPGSDAQDIVIAAWARAIKVTAPELTLFEDPNWERPDQTKIQEALTAVDILCPNLPAYKQGGEPVRKYFENLRQAGKELWFYQCGGPAPLYDPQGYYRYQPWQAFSIGATGQGFWAFGDTGGAPTSWNEYSMTRNNDAPAFVDKNSVDTSIHFEALREGIEDYEELAMLADAIKASNDTAWKTKAQKVLDAAVTAVTGSWTKDSIWSSDPDPALADMQLRNVRRMLEK